MGEDWQAPRYPSSSASRLAGIEHSQVRTSMSQLPQIPVVLVLNLDRHLTRERAVQWRRFYKHFHDDVRIVDFCHAYCPSQIRRRQGRYRILEHWKPLAVYALCPPGMKEVKR